MLVHGFAEHLGRYQHIAEFFAEKGWRVTAVEFRGHGESEGKRGHTNLVDEILRRLESCNGYSR